MMKKIKILSFALLTFALFQPNVKAGWDEIGSGNGYGSGSGSTSKCSSTQGCYCKWNNANYGALKFSIIYYDGNYRYTLGSPVAYYNTPNGTSSNWVTQRIRGAKHKSWLPYTSANNSNSQGIENALIGGTQKNSGYPIIKEIFRDTGVDYNALLAALNSNGTYKDGNRVFNNMVNEKIGTKGSATKGVRVIVEPIVTIQSAGVCNSYKTISDKAFTVKKLFEWSYGQRDSGRQVVPNYSLTAFAKLLWLENGDAGYSAASPSVSLSQVSSESSGWGLNIYGPFDEIVSDVCDPDEEYEGYSSGVQYCCKKLGISPSDKSKNKTKAQGGKLKRPLTDAEINTECFKQKCDPNIDGVDKCCVDCGVSPNNLENNKKSECMTGPIDPSKLVDSTCNKGGGQNCQYALDVTLPNKCDSTNAGHVEDITSWQCAFNSSNNDKVKNHYLDGTDDNPYCAVYCQEEVDFLLPESGVETSAGRFLILGDITSNLPNISEKIKPITYKGKKTCRVTTSKGSSVGKINKDKFEKDMRVVEDQISTYWDRWKIWEAKQRACISGSGNYNNVKYTCKLDQDGNKPNYSTNVVEAKKLYESAIKLREKNINKINACTQYATDRDFDFKPVVEFEYDEPTYGYNSDGSKKKWTLDILENTEVEQAKYTKLGTSTASTINGTSNIEYITNTMYSCTGSTPCKKTNTYKYPNVAWWESTKDVEYKYALPENTYQYVSKSTARSFDSKVEAGGSNAVDMGLENLPIHVSTLPGFYDYKVTTKSLGAGNKFNPYLIDKKPFNSVNYTQLKDYSCKFEVNCEAPVMIPDVDKFCEKCEGKSDLCTTCPPNNPNCNAPCNPGDPGCDKGGPLGVDIIYRTISLISKDQAFPGDDGSGRTPGSNWNDTEITNNITNNRGFENYDIYKQSPMYEITLTPTLMKEIREYNKKQNSKLITIYDGNTANTGVAGYGDYDSMKCLGNGTMCISNVIRDWGIDGCGIKNYDKSKFSKCNKNIDDPWGLN